MSETMTAIAIEGGKGPAEALKAVTANRPEPGPGQILIKVTAAAADGTLFEQRSELFVKG